VFHSVIGTTEFQSRFSQITLLSLHIKYFTGCMYFSRFNRCEKGNEIIPEESQALGTAAQ
jgi:hypothetical protein